MKSERKECALSDVIELTIDHRGKTPKKLGGDWSNVSTPYKALSAKNIKTGQVVQPETIRYVDERLYRLWMRDEILPGDILVTSEAPFGQLYLWKTNEKIVLSQRLFGLRVKQEVNPCYVYYYMITPKFQGELHARATGTTVEGLRQPELLKCKLYLPSLVTQRKIAAVLSSLDDKIETNNAICRNLEEQADAFYKQHFVSGEKSSWNEGKLSDLIDVKYGKDHKKLADGTIPVYGSGGLMRYAERALYESESVLIPRKGTLNNVMLVMAPFWTVDTMFYSVMKVKNAAKFVFHFLKGKDLASMNAGSAVPSMTTEILNSMELRLPPKAVLADFEHNVAPIYQAIATKKCENDCLAALRDTLLPRLMSGELDVSAVKL